MTRDGAHYTELESDPRYAVDDKSLKQRRTNQAICSNLFNACQPIISIKDDMDNHRSAWIWTTP